MSSIIIIVLFTEASGRLALNSDECSVYINKLYKLQTFSEIKFDDQNITVTFGYNDTLFNNKTFWGLTPEDGKEPYSTCFNLKINFYETFEFKKLLSVQNPILQSSFNFTTQFRYLTFILDFINQAKLYRSSSGQYFTVSIGFQFQEAQSHQIIRIFFAKFKIIIGNSHADILKSRYLALPNLTFCKDRMCSKSYKYRQIVFGQTGFFQQSNLDPHYQSIITKAYFIGNGLNKEIQLINTNYTIPGQAFLQISFDFVWNSFYIQVETYQSNSSEILNFTDNQVKKTIEKLDIECIRLNSTGECPTCSDECQINKGISEKTCPPCLK